MDVEGSNPFARFMTREHGAGKGDSYRKVDRDKYDRNYEAIFGKKKTKKPKKAK